MINKILFFCPIPPPVGGQALISEIVYNLVKPKFLINTNVRNKYLDTLVIISKTLFLMLFRKIDIVYFTCTRSKKGAIKDIILLFLCKIRGVNIINHLHGNEVMDLFDGGFFSRIIHWSYKQIDTTIFVTERQKDLLPSSLGNMKRIVIPNCYDPVLEDINMELKEAKGDIHVLFISFLMKSKGIFIALDTFQKIAENYKNIKFHVAGEPLTDDFMSASEVRELFDHRLEKLTILYPKRFFYHGVVKGSAKKELFLNCDIVLFPTFFKTESFGLVNVEAMRTGNVVITTDHNYLSDIISTKEGLLIEPNNVESAYNAVRYFLDNVDLMLEIQKHNVEHAILEYSPEKFNKRIIELFLQYA